MDKTKLNTNDESADINNLMHSEKERSKFDDNCYHTFVSDIIKDNLKKDQDLIQSDINVEKLKIESNKRHTLAISRRKSMVENLAAFNYKGQDMLESTDPPLVLLKVITQEAGYLTVVKKALRFDLRENISNIDCISIINAWYELFASSNYHNILSFGNRIGLNIFLSWISDEDKIIGSAARGFYLAFNRYSYGALWEVVLSDVKLKDKQETISIWYDKGKLTQILGSLSCSLLMLWFNDMDEFSNMVIKLHFLIFVNLCQGNLLTKNLITDLSKEIPENVISMISIDIVDEENGDGSINEINEIAEVVYCLFNDISILSYNFINRDKPMFNKIINWLKKTADEGGYTFKSYKDFIIVKHVNKLGILAKLYYLNNEKFIS